MLEKDPETGRIVYGGNITFADAMTIEPRILYVVCNDASNKPNGFQGDWPVEGHIYPARVITDMNGGAKKIAILGFEGEWPFYNQFRFDRFDHVATIWPN